MVVQRVESKTPKESGVPVKIRINSIELGGNLSIPEGAKTIVIFAHGSGSSRFSPRNTYVAGVLQKAGMATLLFDLLTAKEDEVYETRFNISLLSQRLVSATKWVMKNPETRGLRIGYFGASTGAAAALEAAPQIGDEVRAIVSRGGRPDMADPFLPKVRASTLLIVGEWDEDVITLNRRAFERMSAEKELVIVPSATHLFEEPGKLEEVARIATKWFTKHL